MRKFIMTLIFGAMLGYTWCEYHHNLPEPRNYTGLTEHSSPAQINVK